MIQCNSAENSGQIGGCAPYWVDPWWIPNTITIYRNGVWSTQQLGLFGEEGARAILEELVGRAVIGLSPLDSRGSVYYVAFDIDSGNPKHVEFLLKLLPRGAQPWVSYSGYKGWHIWLFLDEPISTTQAVRFARAVKREAGLEQVEIFPQGASSKCLKWPGQRHPKTGKIEEYVPPNALFNTGRYDTRLVLLALREGFGRTPAELLEPQYLRRRPRTRKGCPTTGNIKKERAGKGVLHGVDRSRDERFSVVSRFGARSPSFSQIDTSSCCSCEPSEPTSRDRTRRVVAEANSSGLKLASDERCVEFLFRLVGQKPVPLGKPFLCLLHDEKHPSASFYRAADGSILYHDWHAAKYGSPEWLNLGEVYHAKKTGRVERLSRVQSARELAELALRAGVESQLTGNTRFTLQEVTQALKTAGVLPQDFELNRVIGHLGQWKAALERVWAALCREALLSAQYGFSEIKLSVRFLAREAGLGDLRTVCGALNLFCALGVLKKIPNHKGNRFVVTVVSSEEVRRRWEALKKPGPEKVTAKLVRDCLGQDVTEEVFPKAVRESVSV